MGCCASRPQTNPNQRDPTNPPQPVASGANQQVPVAPGLHQADPPVANAHNPPSQHEPSKVSAIVNKQQGIKSQVQPSQHSAIPVIHISEAKEVHFADQSGVSPNQYQSAINPANQVPPSTISYHNKSAINPNGEVPQNQETSSKVPGSPKSQGSNIKVASNIPDRIPSQIHNENEQKLVQLGNVKELLASHEKPQKKEHGEEQVLDTYHQNFEIPLFEVALTAHS